MNKERLTFLKQKLNQDFIEYYDTPQMHFRQNELSWLIEQAEIAEEAINDNRQIRVEFADEIKTLSDENARLRELLEFYANTKHWYYGLNSDVVQDGGDKARQALASEQS